MHYIITIAIIAVIVYIQIRFFSDTKQKINDFLSIFPENSDEYKLFNEILIEKINSSTDDELDKMLNSSGYDCAKYHYTKTSSSGLETIAFRREQAKKDLISLLSANANGIWVAKENETLQKIIDSINDYLTNNKSVSDFHLMKDIVDRNCDSKEEEISTQIPIPLYMGLVGTMAGILIGILYLWLSGGINSLLNVGDDSGANGIEALLGGVALAMVSSIIGILLTTSGSIKFKTAKSVVEEYKHDFLNWIQKKLLPTLSDNVVGAIREMTGNLTEFNKTFSDNTGNLGTALAKVNESYKLQTQLIDAVNKIQEGRTAATNLTLLNKLIESSEQIGRLAEYLHSSNEYLANVRSLNEKLDLQEKRTRTIEEIGAFFKVELEQIESRKGAISKAVGTVDDYLKQALEKLKENSEASFNELQISSVKQQDILRQKTEEINLIVTELKNLVSIKESISKLEQAANSQNIKLENLTIAIQALVNTKFEGESKVVQLSPPIKTKKKFSFWFISIFGLLILVLIIIANANLISPLLNDFLSLFRF